MKLHTRKHTRAHIHVHTHEQTDRQTDRHTDTQTHKHTNIINVKDKVPVYTVNHKMVQRIGMTMACTIK